MESVGGEHDQDAIERVLERASKLAEPDTPTPEPDSLDEQTVIEAALEAGIPSHATSEALAVERIGEAPDTSRLDALAGRRTVFADRHLPLAPDETIEVLDRWLVLGHHLRRHRSVGPATKWTRRRDLVASMQLRARSLAGEGGLGTTASVEARVAGYEGRDRRSMTLVRVTIDRTSTRSTRLAAGGLMAGGGATATALSATGAILAPPAAFVFGAVTLGGVAVVGAGRRDDRQLEDELTVLLDRIARGKSPDSVTAGLIKRIRNRHN